ncbi:MAG: adenylate cyclase [Bacteroidia bacterium]|jgi:adenylate cyclase
MSFFEELKRRNVFRVGVAYGVAGWVLLQVADLVLENIVAPGWVIQALMLVVGLGFVAALVIAWAYELTPEGIKKEAAVDRSQSVAGTTGTKLDRIIIGFLVLAVVYFVWERQQVPEVIEPTAQVETAATTETETPVEAVTAEPSIAVLPFADMSPEKDQEYFSDGIAEELLNLLVRVDGLKVASRTSSFTFKNSPLNIAEIADELKVDHILEGSIRKADNRVRITAQLIDAATDRHLWSDTYDRELEDIFGIQDEIANAIVDALRTELGVLVDSDKVSAEVVTENLDAYQLYLKARGLFLARAELPTAIALFEQAVALDPDFAQAWAYLAAIYSIMESWNHFDRPYMDLASQTAEIALEKDPTLSTPWAVKSQVANDRGNPTAAMRFINKAIEIDPENATHYLWRGIDISTLGFQQESVADLERCLELDPAYENCRRHLAYTKLILNETEAGLRLFQEGAERGYNGANSWYIQRLMSIGERELAVQLVWSGEEIGSLWPGRELLDAMEFPNRDHSKGLAKLETYVESSGQHIAVSSMYYAIFGAYHRVEADPGFPRWIWLDENAGFRQSSYFKPHVEEMGLPEYWRTNGYPPGCRAVGDEDFECD